MGIMGMISDAKAFRLGRKAKFKEISKERLRSDNISRAKELQELREKRINTEGTYRLEKARQRELRRIEKARVPSKLQKFGMDLKEKFNSRRIKSKAKVVKTIREGAGSNVFGSSGGSGIDFGGDKGLQVGGSSGGIQYGGSGKTFSFGEEKPKPKPR